MGHGSTVELRDGSRGSWVTKDDPFSSLSRAPHNELNHPLHPRTIYHVDKQTNGESDKFISFRTLRKTIALTFKQAYCW